MSSKNLILFLADAYIKKGNRPALYKPKLSPKKLLLFNFMLSNNMEYTSKSISWTPLGKLWFKHCANLFAKAILSVKIPILHALYFTKFSLNFFNIVIKSGHSFAVANRGRILFVNFLSNFSVIFKLVYLK